MAPQSRTIDRVGCALHILMETAIANPRVSEVFDWLYPASHGERPDWAATLLVITLQRRLHMDMIRLGIYSASGPPANSKEAEDVTSVSDRGGRVRDPPVYA